MKGAEFYEGGRIQVYIELKEREKKAVKKRVQGSLGWVWRRKRGGARKGGAKYEKGQNEKGVPHGWIERHSRNSQPLANRSLTLCTLFFTAFQPWNHLRRGWRGTKGKPATWKGSITVLLLRSRTKIEAIRWNFLGQKLGPERSVFEGVANFKLQDRGENGNVHFPEIFILQKSDSNISNSRSIP